MPLVSGVWYKFSCSEAMVGRLCLESIFFSDFSNSLLQTDFSRQHSNSLIVRLVFGDIRLILWNLSSDSSYLDSLSLSLSLSLSGMSKTVDYSESGVYLARRLTGYASSIITSFLMSIYQYLFFFKTAFSNLENCSTLRDQRARYTLSIRI